MESVELVTHWEDCLHLVLETHKVKITATESNDEISALVWLDAKDVAKLINVLISFQKELE